MSGGLLIFGSLRRCRFICCVWLYCAFRLYSAFRLCRAGGCRRVRGGLGSRHGQSGRDRLGRQPGRRVELPLGPAGLDERIERACFAVVVGGRMYTVEARGPKGKLDAAARLTAKAVAAGLAVPAVEAPAEPAAPAQEDGPPAEPTSDEKPAADEKKAA